MNAIPRPSALVAVSARLNAIRAVLDEFDWEHDDRQHALERIDQLASASRTRSGIEPGGAAHIAAADVPVVLAALADAAEYKRDRAASCPDCDLSPADLCSTCEWRLAQADGYDAVATRLGGAS